MQPETIDRLLDSARQRLEGIAQDVEQEDNPGIVAGCVEIATAINLQTEVLTDYFEKFLAEWRELIMATRGEVPRR